MSKVCYKCKQTKDIFAFNKDKQKKDGYAAICRECSKNACANYYARTSSTTKRNKKRNGMSQHSPSTYARLWRTENPERAKKARDKWVINNADKIRHKNMLRHTSKLERTPVWLSVADKAEIEAMYLFCQIFKGFEVDHIVPLRGKEVSGMHVPWNLQVIPANVNRAKSNKLLTNWSDLCHQY